LDNDHQSTSATKKEQDKHLENEFISVQKYTGQGFSLPGGEENDKIAEAHHDEVVKAAEQFFLKKYKTKIKVHNLVGNRAGVTVFVESVGEPHFYTYAIVPINEKKIERDNVFSEDKQVEDAIASGIYAMIYDKEFNNLDDYLKSVTKKYKITGITKEAEANVGGDGHRNPFYYMSIANEAFSINVVELYLKHPQWKKSEWKHALSNATANVKLLLINLDLYMMASDQKPNQTAFREIVKKIEEAKDFPPGSYSVFLHNNLIEKDSGRGSEKDLLERSTPNKIIKE
jgi:hypothetical protein